MSNDIKKLTDYEHARLRTEMYLGSRSLHTQTIVCYENNKPFLEELSWVPAAYTAFREIVDNALDEVVGHGHGNRIDITYDEKTKVMSVQDNGRGIPIDYDSEHRCHLATLALTEARAGRNFGERGEVAGTNGIGASVVNFCSEYFNLEIHRDNKKFNQSFKQGDIVIPGLDIGKPKIKDLKSDKTGTYVEFKLSSDVFKDLTLPEKFIKSRVTEIAICNPLIKIYYNGEQIKVKATPEKTLFDGQKPIIIEMKEKDFKSKWLLLPNFSEENETVHTIVNNIPAFNGGVHVETFKKFFYSGLINALEKESKRRKLTPNKSDINEGLLIYNITNMKAPNFDSQSKTRLINETVGKIVQTHLEDELLFKTIIKKNLEWIDAIYARCEARTQKKDASEIAKMSRQVARNKVPKLIDATGYDRSKCILFLAEGDSAIAGMTSVRNPEIHGGLPLRGKIMNVHGESPRKVLDNQALIDIMNSIGLVLGQRANRHTLRYSKIYLATDMDHDGSNIAALLVNFFYHYWPELFDPKQEPVIYVFQTPFVILEKGKERHYFYAFNYDKFIPEEWKGWSITRAKGLGTLVKPDWKHALENLVALPIIDDGKLKETMDLIFNNAKADERKEWIGM